MLILIDQTSCKIRTVISYRAYNSLSKLIYTPTFNNNWTRLSKLNIVICQWLANKLFAELNIICSQHGWTTSLVSRTLFGGSYLKVTWWALGQ